MAVVISRTFDADTVGTLPSGLTNIVGTWQVSTNKAVSAPNGLRCISNASGDIVFDRSGPAARLITLSYRQILKVSPSDTSRLHLMHALLRTPATGGFTDGYWVICSLRLTYVDVVIFRRNASVNTQIYSQRTFTTFADNDVMAVKVVIEEDAGTPTSDVIKLYYDLNAPATTLRAQTSAVLVGNQPPAGHVGFHLDKEFHTADLTIDDLVVDVAGLNPPTITSHPSSITVPTGDLATFSVAHDGTGPFTYQWRRSISGGAFADMAGQTAASLSFITVAGDTGNQYRCVVTGSVAPAATSNAATLTVDNTPAGAVTDLAGTATGGTTATISWTAGTPAGTSYNVEIETPSGAGNWAAPAGVRTGTSFAATGLLAATGYRPRVRAVNGAGASAWAVGAAFTTDNVGTGGGSLPLSIAVSVAAGVTHSVTADVDVVADTPGPDNFDVTVAGTVTHQVTAAVQVAVAEVTVLEVPRRPGRRVVWGEAQRVRTQASLALGGIGVQRIAEEFDPLDPVEVDDLEFDFTSAVLAGETLDEAFAVVSVLSGTDAGAAALIRGAPVIFGNSVLVPVQGRPAGIRYSVRVDAVMSTGRRLPLAGILRTLTV